MCTWGAMAGWAGKKLYKRQETGHSNKIQHFILSYIIHVISIEWMGEWGLEY